MLCIPWWKHSGPNAFTSFSSLPLYFLWLTAGSSTQAADGPALRQ